MSEELVNLQPDTPASVDLPETSITADTGDAETTVDDVPQHAETDNKPAKGVQKRIDELTAQRHRAEREADFYRSLLEQERAQRQPQQQQEPQKQITQEATPPKFEDFDSIEDFAAAMADYKVEQRLQEKERQTAEQARQRQEQETAQKRQQTVAEKVQQAIQKYPDLPTLLSDPSLPVTDTVVDALVAADNFADVANHLARHPEELRQLAGMSPTQVGVAIGRLEARLAAQPAVKPSSAPPPVSPVRPSAAPVGLPDPSKDPEGWIKARNEQARAR